MTEPEQLPVIPGTIRDAALAELDQLTRFVDGLQPDDWKRPSAASGWTIGDVVAHLDLAFGLYNRVLGMVTSGGGSGPVWKALGKIGEAVAPAASPVLNSLNSAIPRLIDRSLAPEVVKGQFTAGARSFRERLERIGPDDYTRPIYYVGGPYPLSFFLAWTVNEMAIHGWDMESRVETAAHLGEPARRVLPWFYWSATPIMLRPPKSTTGSVQVILDEPGAAMWWSISNEKTTQGTETMPNPDVTIRGPSGIYVLTLAGRIPAEDALRSTSLAAEGNQALARAFLSGWKIV